MSLPLLEALPSSNPSRYLDAWYSDSQRGKSAVSSAEEERKNGMEEKKFEGRTTVRMRRVIVQCRLDPAATFLFLIDKGILALILIFPSHFFLPPFFCFFLLPSFSLPLVVFLPVMQQ